MRMRERLKSSMIEVIDRNERLNQSRASGSRFNGSFLIGPIRLCGKLTHISKLFVTVLGEFTRLNFGKIF